MSVPELLTLTVRTKRLVADVVTAEVPESKVGFAVTQKASLLVLVDEEENT